MPIENLKPNTRYGMVVAYKPKAGPVSLAVVSVGWEQRIIN